MARAAVLLHLRPFTREDAHAFLSGKFPGIDADGLLDSLEQRGVEGLYGNPLTLGDARRRRNGDGSPS